MPRHTVHSPEAPPALGPYSHAAAGTGGSLLYLSGQTPVDPETGLLVVGDVAAQTDRVFRNLALVLAASSRDLSDVVKVNVYLTSMRDFDAMNSVYEKVFAPPYPARTTVAVAGLPLGAGIEIEVVAS
jgi:2-iminobutanoate/2-iminopropanoate deaminase